LDVSNTYGHQDLKVETFKPKGSFPEAYVRPRSAYHAPTRNVKYEEAVGEIAAESVMIYPPGIPILIPGEIIDQALVDELVFYVSQGSTILSESEDGYFKVVDKLTWPKWEEIDDEL
jgi:lysine decarboxylase